MSEPSTSWAIWAWQAYRDGRLAEADAMKAQIDAAVKSERERCAKVAETCPFSTPWVAAAIRKEEQP